MASPPPPYSDITGVARSVMKYDAQTSFTNYNGNARPGELVVDTSNYALYIGNADGTLNIVTGGGGGGGGSNISNGTSNVNIATSGGNVSVGVAGTANVLTIGANSFTLQSTAANLVLGRATATGSPGLSSTSSITLTANRGGTPENQMTFGTDGNLSFLSNAAISASGNLTLSSSGNLNLTPTTNTDIFITATGASGGVQIQGGNNIFSLQQGSPEAEFRVDAFNVGINSGTDGDVYFDLTNGGDSNLTIGTANGTATFGSDASLTLEGNLFLPNIAEMTTGNTPVMLWEDSGNGVVGYDSTIYYNHNTETLNIGNLAFSDTPGNTGVSISSAESGVNGSIFFNVAAGSVLTLTGDRRVKWSLLDYANIPNPAVGSIIYNNDTANTANGFYLCADGTVSQSWEKIMAAKGNVVTLPSASAAPTAVLGGIYFYNGGGNAANAAFYMCANTTTGWQKVNLT